MLLLKGTLAEKFRLHCWSHYISALSLTGVSMRLEQSLFNVISLWKDSETPHDPKELIK